MSEHLTSVTLSSLIDGELPPNELVELNQHLAACPQCTSSALSGMLLKNTAGHAGRRYAPPADLEHKLRNLAANHPRVPPAAPVPSYPRWGTYAAVAAILFLCVGLFAVNRRAAHTEAAALLTELSDQHIATLAANAPPEVISSDRHTVKPWFQGRIPFSFNLPQNLPSDVTLDGGNLTYLRGQPAAQLLYSIGKHRVSIFVQQRTSNSPADEHADRSGFHVVTFRTPELDFLAVSDVEPARLDDLARLLEAAQSAR